MNKKGQLSLLATPYGIAIIGLIAVIIAYSVGYGRGSSKINEELNQKLEDEKIYSRGLENQLAEKEIDLDKTLDNFNNCIKNLTEKDEKLITCQDSREVFPLLWLTNFHLTDTFIIVINIYIIVSLSLITIKIIFSNNKKRK